jgi:hypothetical protein
MQIECTLGEIQPAFGAGFGETEVRYFSLDIALSGAANIYTFNTLQMARGTMKM